MNGTARSSLMERSNRFAWSGPLCLCAALTIGTAGCGGGGGFGSATTYPVKGKVLLADGKPLTSGRIAFVSRETALTFAGTIDPDGSFTLKTGTREGAPEGQYQVRIEMDETTLPVKGTAGRRSAQLPFATKYTDEDASKLTAKVTPDGSGNNFEFKLDR
jgi:hypothetical protein